MRVVEGIYDGKAIHPSVPVDAKPNTKVLISFPDDTVGASTKQPSKLDAVAGCLRWSGPTKTIEDMDEAIARGARESFS